MPDVPPFILRKPSLKLTLTPGTPITLQCQGRGMQVVPDQDENDFETFCGTYTTYSPEKWTITFNAYSSFGTDGLWTLVRPLVGKVVDFELLPDADAAVSVTNPKMAGKAIVKSFPFLDAEVSDASEVDVELAVQGTPTFATSGTMAEGQEGSEEESTEQAEEPAAA